MSLPTQVTPAIHRALWQKQDTDDLTFSVLKKTHPGSLQREVLGPYYASYEEALI